MLLLDEADAAVRRRLLVVDAERAGREAREEGAEEADGRGPEGAHVGLRGGAERGHGAHGRLVLRVDRKVELAAEDVGGAARVDAAVGERVVEKVDLLLHLLHSHRHGCRGWSARGEGRSAWLRLAGFAV